MCVEHLSHGGVRLEELLARVARGLGVPGRDREQRRRITDLAMQQRTAGSRRALQDLTRAEPRLGVLLDRVARPEVDLEDELHWMSHKMPDELVVAQPGSAPGRSGSERYLPRGRRSWCGPSGTRAVT